MRSHVEFTSEASVRLAIASFNWPSPACTSATWYGSTCSGSDLLSACMQVNASSRRPTRP